MTAEGSAHRASLGHKRRPHESPIMSVHDTQSCLVSADMSAGRADRSTLRHSTRIDFRTACECSFACCPHGQNNRAFVSFRPRKLAFDLGRCPHRATLQRSAFISHGHMDHIGGLPAYAATRWAPASCLACALCIL